MSSSLTVRSSLNYLSAHRTVATSSMYLQSTYTPHSQQLSNWKRICNPVERLQQSFFAEVVDSFRLLAIFAEELHSGCLIGF